MVSFFGLKLGGDRKKSHPQPQSNDKLRQASRSIQPAVNDFEPPNAQDLKDLKDIRRLTNNFSRPNLIRPSTSSSTIDPTQWRAPYMAGSAASSSLVDLGAPRAPGLGNPRFHSSDVNLNSRPRNSSIASMPMSGSMGGIGASSSEAPARPGTAVSISTKFENPFKTPFGRPGSTSVSPVSGSNPLDHLDFNLGRSDSSPEPAVSTSNSPINGYPSPPPSILSADQPFSPTDGGPGSSRRNAPSGLRNVETTGPRALPSPAASVARTSEETWDPPVIRTIQAKRDTLTFHTPRRQSFSMEVKDYEKQKAKPMVEGLAGNFAAFDFGDCVKSSGSSGKESFDSDGISPTDTRKPKPFPTARTASPLRSMQSSPSLSEMQRLTRERTASDATSFLSSPESLRRESPVPPTQPVSQPAQQPVQQPAPKPAPQPAPQPVSQAPKYQYHDVPVSLRPPAPPPTTAIPPTPTNPPRRDTAPVVAPYSSHPGYMSRPLDPPPRGFRARVGSDARTRGLRVPAPLVDKSGAHNMTGNTRSPYGPPPEEGNYMRTESPSKPPEVPIPDSPFTRGPYEGDFPVQKGLPRGRRPPGLESPGQGVGGLSPRVPSRQRPMYPPPKSEPSPAPSTNASSNMADEYSSALPDWDDFGRSSHRSAMPAPLTPFRNDFIPQTPPGDDPTSPSRGQFTSSPISPKPPSLPSPTFASLQNTISSSSENFAKTFELVDDVADSNPGYPLNRPLISPVMAEFSRSLSPSTRVEAKRAPPRPNPITVPPSADPTERERAARAPRIAVDSFSPGFI